MASDKVVSAQPYLPPSLALLSCHSLTRSQNLYASKQYYDPALQKGTVNQIDPALLTYAFESPNPNPNRNRNRNRNP